MEDLMKLPELSWEEIRKHTSAESCWCVFHGLVYDLTKFLNKHPGGSHIIIETAGRDATDAFEDIGHSLEARIMADEYIIGRVEGATNIRRCKPEAKAERCVVSAAKGSPSTGVFIAIFLVALIGIWAYFQFQDEDSTFHHRISAAPQHPIE
ncbi:putative cytochrome b5 [Cyclospora cayetanensis]|uniref:Cytochrome b5 n=1 Tax=Cyclospora cayetanensis TaxID=88456 RepID=A0A1D3CVA3_9EIME|nr:putative cytochrome b5 [Cyclospora cayetanensis]